RGLSQAVHRVVQCNAPGTHFALCIGRVTTRSSVKHQCPPRTLRRLQKGVPMRYQVITSLTPREALEQALADFGPGGVGVHIPPQPNLRLVLQGGGGHIAVTAEPGAKTTLELETREWDYAVEQFMVRVQRRRPWWQRWWRRKQPGTSRPASFTVPHHS